MRLMTVFDIKNLTTTFCFVLAVAFLVAQEPLVADAGSDKHFCDTVSSDSSEYFIGGSPTASGGTPPYSYRWFFEKPVTKLSSIYHVADVLNDSTLSNPRFVMPMGDPLQELILEVTDSIGNKATDTLVYTFFSVTVHFGGQMSVFAQHGDTIEINAEFPSSAIPFIKCHWQDTTEFISPDTLCEASIVCQQGVTPRSYSVVLTDSVGCVIESRSAQKIIVLPLSVESVETSQWHWPQTFHVNSPINLPAKGELLRVSDIMGRGIGLSVQQNQIIISKPGIYLFTFKIGKDVKSFKSIVL